MVGMYRVELLEDRLQSLVHSTPGMRAAVIVSMEGFVVASYSKRNPDDTTPPGTNSPQVAAMAATLFALGEQTLLRLAQGSIERLLIEGESGAMIVYPINRDAALATMLTKEAKMGVTLLAVARAARALDAILGREE